jgi:hypothetical protein
VRIEAEAGALTPMDRIELLLDGEVVESVSAPEGVRHASLAYEFQAGKSCWFALRVQGPKDPWVIDDAVFAHTSPVCVTVDGAPRRSAEDAAYFVEWIERLIAMTLLKGRFASDAERDAVIAEFRAGQAYYRAQLTNA